MYKVVYLKQADYQQSLADSTIIKISKPLLGSLLKRPVKKTIRKETKQNPCKEPKQKNKQRTQVKKEDQQTHFLTHTLKKFGKCKFMHNLTRTHTITCLAKHV